MLEPVTLAVNCCVPPVESDAEPGLMETATVCGALTVTVAEAVFMLEREKSRLIRMSSGG